LLQVLKQLGTRWRQLAAGGIDLAEAWQRWCLLTGRTVQVIAGEQRHAGHCRGIGPDGALLVHTERGEQRIFGGTVASWE
jgi:biotin-(acetyl-CoA carboxylase) ligase